MVFNLIWWVHTKLLKICVSMTFPPSVFANKIVKFLPIRVHTRVDGRGYVDTDRCSLPYRNKWFPSINGHRYTDTGTRTRTGVAWAFRRLPDRSHQNTFAPEIFSRFTPQYTMIRGLKVLTFRSYLFIFMS